MHLLSLRSGTLRLLPATLTLARAELTGRDAFSAALGLAVPPAWPPPLTEDTVATFAADLADPARFPWSKWYVVDEEPAMPVVIGIVGFKGPPANRAVEIGYSLIESHHRRGIATRAVALLIEWCGAGGWVDTVSAHTLPELGASIRVLEKNGFHCCGAGTEPGAVRYERRL